MARKAKDDKAARFGTLHELLTRAEALGLDVQVSLHSVPSEELLDWLSRGLLDVIEQGAGSNPPTGKMESGTFPNGRAAAVAFMEDARDRERRIKRQEDETLAAITGAKEVA